MDKKKKKIVIVIFFASTEDASCLLQANGCLGCDVTDQWEKQRSDTTYQ